MTLAQQHAARNRRPLPPAFGSCRWLAQLTDTHPGVLVIETERGGKPVSEAYTVTRHATGYQLAKRDGTVYDLPLTLDGCDCKDATFRLERSGGLCKHARALKAALAALGTFGAVVTPAATTR